MKRAKRAIAFFGTSSFAGKSLLTAAFCRILADSGIKVAPFKAQNMSLNSYVTKDNREIARAQAFQAFAAGIEPEAEMNPILLKPKGNGISQVIVEGRPYKDMDVEEYYDFAKKEGVKIVKKCIEKLYNSYEILVIEGAGSCAEINFYSKDIANFKVAEIAEASVFLVADIERGGAFAGIYGTLSLLKEKHRRMIKGIIINKFRGNKNLLDNGIKKIEKLTGKTVIGIVPFIEGIKIPEEDSVGMLNSGYLEQGKAEICVIKLPFISNFTDFDALALDQRAEVKYVSLPEELNSADAIIIPGTKNTIAALKWLREHGFDEKLKEMRGKVPIIGICGGYQILGREIIDYGIEDKGACRISGLGFLDISTEFRAYEKEKRRIKAKIVCGRGMLREAENKIIEGYEIHMGRSRILSEDNAKVAIKKGNEILGVCDSSGMVLGSYIHGLFDLPYLRNSLLNFIIKKGENKKRKSNYFKTQEIWEKEIKRIAEIVKNNVSLDNFNF